MRPRPCATCMPRTNPASTTWLRSCPTCARPPRLTSPRGLSSRSRRARRRVSSSRWSACARSSVTWSSSTSRPRALQIFTHSCARRRAAGAATNRCGGCACERVQPREVVMGRLDGKVAVVLGAAARDNMGQVIARRFAAEGATVVVAGRQGDALAALAAELRGKHALCDITKKADVETLAKVATETYGRVDIAVNCTGWGLMAKLLETTEEQIDKLTALQFKGPYFFLQTFCA